MQIENGKIYGLVGENGAGKSVLVNIISGLYKPDSGDIYIQGNRVELNKPQVVRELKITTLHQSLSLIEDLTVAENVFLGDYIIKGKYFRHIDWKEINNKCKYYFKILGFKIDPKDFVRDLNYSQKQVVEIAKALSRDSRMIIFDEPTIFLNNVEIENFRKILKNLADKGITIMYISHQLKEVINLCDSIFVIRDGQIATNIQKPYVNEDLIIKHMTRITISDIYPKLPNRIDRPVLRVDSVSTESDIRNV
ncbi:MAG: sugar ABC transporter ATP-binding protein, partial [Thermoanaerobacteraceae bacterium]|nr:sugar ABC transporter ATP-binding protein [Thermoanaerobacteraceae bacterium]